MARGKTPARKRKVVRKPTKTEESMFESLVRLYYSNFAISVSQSYSPRFADLGIHHSQPQEHRKTA